MDTYMPTGTWRKLSPISEKGGTYDRNLKSYFRFQLV